MGHKLNSLYFTIGLPRSGKSTFCNEWVNEKPNRVMVRADDIRMEFGHRFNEYIEPMIHAQKILMIRTLLRSGHDVIVDGTHTTWNSIKELLNIDSNAHPYWIGWKIGNGIEDFNRYASVCKDRAVKTNQSDLCVVIERMKKQMEDLSIIFWKKLEEQKEEAKKKVWHVV